MKFLVYLMRTVWIRANTNLMRMCFFGLLSGILAAFVIILFRHIIAEAQSLFLANPSLENYEDLPAYLIFLLPLAGGIIIGALFHLIPADKRQVGVVHTLEQIKHHQARLPVTNFVIQFIGAAISIVFGHSVGREGPSVHLGASSGYCIAYLLGLSEQTRRTLLACGAAAAIAASFNTPIAAVIFVVEVILLEYALLSMMPIIIASSSATLLSHAFFRDAPTLTSPPFGQIMNSQILAIIFCGIVIGLLAVTFNRLLLTTAQRCKHSPIFWRLTLAGGMTGLMGLAAPQILSMGYDTLTAAFHNEIALNTLISILIFKLLASSIGLGLGLPGGLICPTLVIGAIGGSLVGTLVLLVFPDSNASPGLFAMIGMAAMMGASLQAPLAALLAIFELTLNPHIILPGLIAIVVASLVASEFLNQPSIFISIIRNNETAKQIIKKTT
ncbi:MAG TPA: chloride channel protein [Gammaproteobacteria bacterium]|nr:chloride channel protein [Gammaproteobacteria bacterium]